MNIKAVFYVQGGLLLLLSVALLSPLPFALLDGDRTFLPFLISSTVCLFIGLLLNLSLKNKYSFSHREAFGVVTFAWIIFAIFGSIPYLLTGVLPQLSNAFFEAMSGFTTTGSTVIADLSLVPRSVLFWRSMTQWIGGMGIIVLSLAILPLLGVGGMNLFRAEAPGPTEDRLSPRIQDTAKVLWVVYGLFTVLEVVFLTLGGMDSFEAICHSLTTLATGGFSTRNESIGAYSSPFIQWTITGFMFLAGVNFSLHFQALIGNFRGYFKSQEFLFYLGLILAAGTVTGIVLISQGTQVEEAFRLSFFQVVSISTTTGYGSADYEAWPFLSQMLIGILMIIGGCAGSTAGGIKGVRVFLTIKYSFIQVFRYIHPKGVKLVKLDHKAVDDDTIQKVLGFVALFAGTLVLCTVFMTALGLDLDTALSSVLTCLANVGPGFGQVGPTENFAQIPGAGKLILAFCMLLGRLELYTVLVLFFPSFWKR